MYPIKFSQVFQLELNRIQYKTQIPRKLMEFSQHY